MGEVIFRRKGYKNNYMTKGKSEETINDAIDEISDQIPNETLDEIIDGLTLFDDDLMGLVFENNIEATEQVLQIVLGRKTLCGIIIIAETFDAFWLEE